MVSALDPLNQLYGSTNIHEFGPRKLKLVRDDMIRRNWSRNVVNGHIHRIRRAIKWAIAEQLVSPTLLEALKALPGLRYGKSEARETEPVMPVADEHVAATLPYRPEAEECAAKVATKFVARQRRDGGVAR